MKKIAVLLFFLGFSKAYGAYPQTFSHRLTLAIGKQLLPPEGFVAYENLLIWLTSSFLAEDGKPRRNKDRDLAKMDEAIAEIGLAIDNMDTIYRGNELAFRRAYADEFQEILRGAVEFFSSGEHYGGLIVDPTAPIDGELFTDFFYAKFVGDSLANKIKKEIEIADRLTN